MVEPMDRSDKQERLERLYRLMVSIQDTDTCRALLEDLCTAKELENMAERCWAARLLIEGNTYNQVMERSDISTATLSRVSRCVQYGKGYSALLKK